MLAQFNQPQPSHLQLRVDPARVTTYAEQVQRYVTYRLTDHFAKRNQDGTRFAPTVSGCHVSAPGGIPTFLTITFDPERLWHFNPERMMEQELIRALSMSLRRPVVAFYNEPHFNSVLPTGICFMVVLRDLRKLGQIAAPALPCVAKLDLAAHNGDHKNKLLVPIGVGKNGAAWKHISTIKHAAFVGTTDSGKTTWIQSALAALLTENDPEFLRVALIDLKRNEFVFWHGAPHRFGEVAYTVGDALDLLKQIEGEVNRRGEIMGAALARNILSYNQVADADKRLPYLLVIVDEALDLVEGGRGGGVTNALLKNIATGGRSAGVFLWAGTQYPSAAEGLSRVISSNLRVFAFRMDSVAARVVACPAAQSISEKTPGRMYARFDDGVTEFQSFYLDDDELADIARRAGFVAGSGAASAARNEIGELITRAVKENGGVLTAGHIRAMLGQWRGSECGPREARRIAERMECDGLLAKNARDNNRRCVTDLAREKYGLT